MCSQHGATSILFVENDVAPDGDCDLGKSYTASPVEKLRFLLSNLATMAA
jgi:hypothetical protein